MLTKDEMPEEFDRRHRHAAAILAMLREAGERGVTNGQLVTVSHRFGGRLKELRDAGHPIAKEHLGGGAWRYWLAEAPAVEAAPVALVQRSLFGEVA